MYLPASPENKFDVWMDGVRLGIKLEGGESIIGTTGGVVQARNCIRKPEEGGRWSNDVIDGLNGVRGSCTQEQEVDWRSSRRSDCLQTARGSLSKFRARTSTHRRHEDHQEGLGEVWARSRTHGLLGGTSWIHSSRTHGGVQEEYSGRVGDGGR